MRTIKFRGYSPARKEWVKGDLITYRGTVPEIIYPGGSANVIPESVGQYTGLKDSKGTEIYEGDVLRQNDGLGFDLLVEWDECGWTVNNSFLYSRRAKRKTVLRPSFTPSTDKV